MVNAKEVLKKLKPADEGDYKGVIGSSKGIRGLRDVLSQSNPKSFVDDWENNPKVQKLSDQLLQEIAKTKSS